MKNSSIYVGITIVSEDETGVKSVRYHGVGPDWHGLDDAYVVAMERALMPLAPKYAALGMEADEIMLKVGEGLVAGTATVESIAKSVAPGQNR